MHLIFFFCNFLKNWIILYTFFYIFFAKKSISHVDIHFLLLKLNQTGPLVER